MSYLNAVKRGCEKAGVPVWTPYQLRHLAKDEITRKHGIEVAQVILGHESVDMTTHYGGQDFELVKRFAG